MEHRLPLPKTYLGGVNILPMFEKGNHCGYPFFCASPAKIKKNSGEGHTRKPKRSSIRSVIDRSKWLHLHENSLR